ncbi:hypothetical protein AJZ74_09745 [Listeria monocytogenes]|nr:hypothetical protein AJZ74_09745 [Listeria monocytogenes]
MIVFYQKKLPEQSLGAENPLDPIIPITSQVEAPTAEIAKTRFVKRTNHTTNSEKTKVALKNKYLKQYCLKLTIAR